MQKALQEAGFTRVYNIKEGMAGCGAGPGWIARGLPVEARAHCWAAAFPPRPPTWASVDAAVFTFPEPPTGTGRPQLSCRT